MTDNIPPLPPSAPQTDNPTGSAMPKTKQRRFGLLLLVGMTLWMVAFGWFGLQLGYMRVPYMGEDQLVVIAPGTGLRAIAKQLAEAEVVPSKSSFMASSLVFGQHRRFKAGEYQFKTGQTGRQIADAIANGRVYQRLFTVVEGFTSRQVVQRLEEAEGLTDALTIEPAEGTLLPETYAYRRGEKRPALVARMQKDMTQVVQAIWASRREGLPLRSAKDMVILASIVEAETPQPEERSRVAAVYLNRLARNMPLQADPTVAYAVGDGLPMDRQLTRADLAIEHPFNTYRINGLPPAPIGNPGRASLWAVAQAQLGSELFFVADGKGGHVFANTYEDHLTNVAAWRKSKGANESRKPEDGAVPPQR
ncbi:MAG: endolytic transglycosylase MltG [Alphaproteobacteria bacterium]|nr:endolytic transglycosylase MltG [Alphaproteobacteria bacterium]